ncbi:hypothetical protein SFRURICE_002544 [Spodoptera frugiperda]|nr:hypothetical protein SFRURICE_002544 [Spodoptera frugiperda]
MKWYECRDHDTTMSFDVRWSEMTKFHSHTRTPGLSSNNFPEALRAPPGTLKNAQTLDASPPWLEGYENFTGDREAGYRWPDYSKQRIYKQIDTQCTRSRACVSNEPAGVRQTSQLARWAVLITCQRLPFIVATVSDARQCLHNEISFTVSSVADIVMRLVYERPRRAQLGAVVIKLSNTFALFPQPRGRRV